MMKLSLILCLLYFVSSFSQPQKREIDSLKLILKKTINEKEIFELNFKIAKIYYKDFDFKNATRFAKKNIPIATNLKLKPELAETNKFLALVYINDTKNDSAEYFNKKGYLIFKQLNDKKGMGKSLLYFALISQNKSDFVKQAEYNFQSIKIALQIKDTAVLEVNYRSLAMLNLDQKNYELALMYSFESLEYSKKLGKQDKIAYSLASVAETYSMIKDYKNAKKYFEDSYKIFKNLNDIEGQSWVLTNWANIQDDKTKSFKMRLEAQKYLDITGPDNIMSMNNLGSLGILYSNMEFNSKEKFKNLNLAEHYLERSLKISLQSQNLDHRVEFLQALAEIQAKKGEFKSAYNTLFEYIKLEDSLFSQENKNQIAKLESQKDIELRDKQIQINKIALKAKEKQKWFLLSGMALLAVIGCLLFYQNKNRKKTNKKLQNLNTNLDQANKTKIRLLSILNHDLRGPVNSFIHYIQFQKENPEVLDQETKSRIENQTLSSAKNLLHSMEDILLWTKDQMDNFNPVFKNIEIMSVFEDTKNHFSGEKNLKLVFENPENIILHTDENFLKTIIRNFTGNAIKALSLDYTLNDKNATIIWKAWQKENNTYLSISDNSSGANAATFRNLYIENEISDTQSGLGLHLIRDLAKAINCEISVDSKENIGTTFVLKL